MGFISKEAQDKYDKLVAGRNFRQKDQIILGYNESIKSYERYRRAVADGNYNEAAEDLSTAACKLAATVEWAAKHIVFYHYDRLLRIYPQSASKDEWERICRFKKESTSSNGGDYEIHMNTSDVMRIIKCDFQQKIIKANLTFNFIDDRETREDLINGYKHSGIQPNASAFVQTLDELYRFICAMILSDEECKSLRNITDNYPDSWENLLLSCGYFKPSRNRRFVLLTDCIDNEEYIRNLFRIDWDLILDFSYFDSISYRSDLYEKYIALPDRRKVVLKYLCDFRSSEVMPISSQTYWIKVNGRVSTSQNIDKILDDRNLARQYVAKNFSNLLGAFAREYDMNIELIVLGCANFVQATNRILQVFDDVYGSSESLTVHFIDADNGSVKNHILSGNAALSEDMCKFYKLTEAEFSRELAVDVGEYNQVAQTSILIPSTSSAKGDVDVDTYQAMKSVMDLVYLGIELSYDESNKYVRGEAFLRGDVVADWDVVSDDNFVIPQEKESEIRNSIIREIEEGSRNVYRIEYEAGLGGTTFMRRMAWHLHNDYPTVVVSRYLENDVVTYLKELYQRSGKGVLIFIDSNDVGSGEVSKLQGELLRDIQFSFVIVYMVRKGASGRVARHLRRLNYTQCCKMRSNLLPYINQEKCKNNLDACLERAKTMPMEEEDIPFVLSMYAFDEEFEGIEPYVRHGLECAEEREKDIAFILALADYANYRVGSQYFKSVYGMNYLRGMRGDNYALSSLIKIVYDDTGKREAFKLKYPLFGGEILKYFSGGAEISFTALADRIEEMIRNSRRDEFGEVNQETINLLNKLLIERGEGDGVINDIDVKGVYSPLITKLVEESKRNNVNLYDDSANVVVRLFETLVNVYPEEPHFAAHLARYCFYTIKNYAKGFEYISKAIEVAKDKEKYSMGSLYHIKAMGYFAKIQVLYERDIIPAMEHVRKVNSIETDYKKICQCLHELKVDLAFARELFEEARKESTSRFISNVAECQLSLKIQTCYDKLRAWCMENGCEVLIEDSEQVVLYDRIDSLVEDCDHLLNYNKGEINNYNTERLKEIKEDLKLTKAQGEDIAKICRQLIQSGTPDMIKRARRKLARIEYEKIQDNLEKEESQQKLKEIVAMMEDNFEVDASNNANFRIWFSALRALNAEDEYVELDSIFNKLERWTMLENASPDAFYYKYIVRFIQAYEDGTLETSSKVQSDLREMLVDLKNAASDIMKKTIPFEWFSDYGKGLRRLIRNQELNQMDKKNAIRTLHLFRGALPNKESFAGKKAFISFGQQLVYFNPEGVSERITGNDENQYVSFGLGFSYDGLRSYHDSINILKRGVIIENRIVPTAGKRVTVKVIGSNASYVKTEILNSGGARCDIRISDMEIVGIPMEIWTKRDSTFEIVLSEQRELASGDIVWWIDVHGSTLKKEEDLEYRPFDKLADMLKEK